MWGLTKQDCVVKYDVLQQRRQARKGGWFSSKWPVSALYSSGVFARVGEEVPGILIVVKGAMRVEALEAVVEPWLLNSLLPPI